MTQLNCQLDREGGGEEVRCEREERGGREKECVHVHVKENFIGCVIR